VSVAVTEIMEIWVASRLGKGPASVPYWHGCQRASKLKVVVTHFLFRDIKTSWQKNRRKLHYYIYTLTFSSKYILCYRRRPNNTSSKYFPERRRICLPTTKKKKDNLEMTIVTTTTKKYILCNTITLICKLQCSDQKTWQIYELRTFKYLPKLIGFPSSNVFDTILNNFNF
jgi:hypothetical protein